MEQYHTIIVNLDTQIEESLIIEVDEAETTEDIRIGANVSDNEIVSVAYNYLSAYQDFRDKLLKMGYGWKCNGSRINAVQSGMMSGTDKIYLVCPGEKAITKDIVNIFAYAEIDEFPDTKQQKDYFEVWMVVYILSMLNLVGFLTSFMKYQLMDKSSVEV